ncbi:MAG: glycoside hydrolase family 25 protein [Chthoniobacterales bacterium]|nr:glycoside hydrolase family 25 protein [Chthoniobacterales bacterium]
MNFFLMLSLLIAQLLPVCAFAGNSVVNLSHYDLMRPDFVAMRNEGIVGVFHEASYPRAVRDEKYASRQNAAVRAGLLWGAYHFADATDPVRQADFFLNAVSSAWRAADSKMRPDEVLLVLDFEKNGHYPGGTMAVHQAVSFAERIRERTGQYPGIYSGEYRIRDVVNHTGVSSAYKEVLKRCWLWVANYHYEPITVSPWSRWSLWQYTGDGVCDLPRRSHPKNIANVRNAERNIFRGSDAALRAFWQDHAWRPGYSNASAD